MGNLQIIPTLLQSEAFHRWSVQWKKSFPGEEANFQVFPFQGMGAQRGVLLGIFATRTKDELSKSVEFFEELVLKLSSFCDQQTPLLQSKNAKAQPKSVAGSADLSRN